MNPLEGNVSDGNHSSYSLCNKATLTDYTGLQQI